MDLVYSEIYDGYYWKIFDDGTHRCSQLFESPPEEWMARRENRIIWDRPDLAAT